MRTKGLVSLSVRAPVTVVRVDAEAVIDATEQLSGWGAYGLRIVGLAATQLLLPAKTEWPALRVEARVERPPIAPDRLDEDHAGIALRSGGRLTIERQTGLARFAVPRRLSEDELIHPYLAPAAAVMAHWNDRLSFHAGAFCVDGRVWGVLGDREAGKSSMLAALAAVGEPIVTDDVLVVWNAIAFTGPRSIDLREEAANELELGVPLGIVGNRPRWRVSLPPLVAEGSLGGWVFLEWGDTVEAIPMPPSQRLSRLIEHRALRAAPMTPTALLELAALPAWTLRRPRDWRQLNAATTKLLDVTSGSR